MSLERNRIIITSADKYPRARSIEVAGVRIPVRDAVTSLIFAGLIGASISMIPHQDTLTEPPRVEQADPNSLESLRKSCQGRIISNGRGSFSCEPTPVQPKKSRDLNDMLDPIKQFESKTNSRKEEV